MTSDRFTDWMLVAVVLLTIANVMLLALKVAGGGL